MRIRSVSILIGGGEARGPGPLLYEAQAEMMNGRNVAQLAGFFIFFWSKSQLTVWTGTY